jgi:hypothetical protein
MANVAVLVVGGGGGGGGGDVIYNASFSLDIGTYDVTVGDGGLGSTSNSSKGSNGISIRLLQKNHGRNNIKSIGYHTIKSLWSIKQ